jgi:hypothetical protein
MSSRFAIRTVSGGALLVLPKPTREGFLGASSVLYEIKDLRTGFTQYYHFTATGPTLGILPGNPVLPSTWTYFRSATWVNDARCFGGAVILKSTSLVVGGFTVIDWITGPAAGSRAAGWSWGGDFDLATSAFYGKMKLND